MNIGIIGSGRIGATLAHLCAHAGHRVAISNSRGPESLSDLVNDIGEGVQAMSVEDAVSFGDVVILAVPFVRRESLPPAERFAGKTVVDAMNPYSPDGGMLDLGGLTSSGAVAEQLPGARLVKAFNTILWTRLRDEGRSGPLDDRLVVFVAGDDADAKAVVSQLIEEIGFAPLDTGSLADSHKQEPGSPIYNRPLNLEEARSLL